ncbi:MAG TPA: asparaginase [Gaiellaceae bacterium]|nr:asparaginase [Gaiellaceae bacterium]
MGVVVVSTGGTIAMRPDPGSGKLVPAVSGEELVEMLRWQGAPPLELDDFASVPSFDMHGELALALAGRVAEHCRRDDVSGVVVTHGTDTMEETVYTVDRLHSSEKPVVFTGAQRAADEPDTDGPRNLRSAIRAALAPASTGRGALVAFAGELHAAREARKVHTSALAAFASPGYGPLGHVDEDRVTYRRRPERNPPLPAPAGPPPQVDLIRLHAGSDDRFLRCSLQSGSRAIVLEATGRGNANERVLPGVRAAVAAGVPVVVCSRCLAGRVEPVYGRGGGKDLAEAGAQFAGDLAGPKARVLLQLVLAADGDVSKALAAEAG